jgi:glutamyl-tRNA reductase
LALLDLSLPRAIAPESGALPGVVLHDLSGFEQVVAYNRARREREIPRVEALLERELEMFEARARESRVRPLVAELRQRAEEIRREELERAIQKDGAVDQEMLDRVTRRLVDRLLQVPSQALRRGDLALDPQHAGYLRTLFGLGGGHGDDQHGSHRAGHHEGNGDGRH